MPRMMMEMVFQMEKTPTIHVLRMVPASRNKMGIWKRKLQKYNPVLRIINKATAAEIVMEQVPKEMQLKVEKNNNNFICKKPRFRGFFLIFKL
jgi:hypothetical protein